MFRSRPCWDGSGFSIFCFVGDGLCSIQLKPSTTSTCHLSNEALEVGAEIALLSGNFKVAIDDGDGQQNPSAASQGAEHVGSDGQSTNAGTAKGGSSGDDALEFLVHALFTMAGHDETLFLEGLCHVTGCGARDLDPRLGEDGTGYDDEGDVDDGVDWIQKCVGEAVGGRHVVCDTTGGKQLRGSFLGLPGTDELDEEVVREAGVQHLADHEDVGRQCRLQHDRHVGGVKETDGVRTAHASLAGRLDGDLDAEALQVDDSGKDGQSGEQVHDVGEMLSVECLAQGPSLVWPGHQQMEEGNDGAFKFFAASCVDGGWGKGFPDDGLADIGGNEERNSRAQTVSFLQQLIQKNDHQSGQNQLNNQEQADTGTQVAGLAIQTSKNENAGLSEGEDDGKELLRGLVEFTVGLEVEIDVDEVGSGQ